MTLDVSGYCHNSVIIAGHNGTVQMFHRFTYSVKTSGNVIEPPEFCGVYALLTVHLGCSFSYVGNNFAPMIHQAAS